MKRIFVLRQCLKINSSIVPMICAVIHFEWLNSKIVDGFDVRPFDDLLFLAQKSVIFMPKRKQMIKLHWSITSINLLLLCLQTINLIVQTHAQCTWPIETHLIPFNIALWLMREPEKSSVINRYRNRCSNIVVNGVLMRLCTLHCVRP